MEAFFSAAGWNVINLIWGRHWDELLEKDTTGALRWVMNNTVDGEYQNFKAKEEHTPERIFGKHPDALKLVENMTDEQIENLNRGGHDPIKVYNAYKQASSSSEKPTVILAFTIKGYGIGSRQADNTTHQVKKLSKENLKHFKDKFNLPVSDDSLDNPPYLKFDEKSEEYKYLHKCREKLNGLIPARPSVDSNITPESLKHFKVFDEESKRELSTTMVFVQVLTSMLRDKNIGKLIVPIVPDEANFWNGWYV